jgi:cytochrome c
MKGLRLKTILASTLFMLAASAPAHAAIDVDAAKALFKENDCGKCHSPDKTKKGPSLKKIASKYKGKPDGQEKAIKNMTAGQKVKLEDGTEEDHKVINTKDVAAQKNLADWMLSH